MINIFIGYDLRETVGYHVCSNSLIRHSTMPLSLTPLALNNLTDYREKHNDGSNQFIYSRFLVPHLMGFKGWALFIDGDMIVRNNIAELWAMRDYTKAVMCVQHEYQTKTSVKYLGSVNKNYPRKNWSSVVLWNCEHPSNRHVTPSFVESSTGAELHRFSWLNDNEIGKLPIEWNWLPDEFGENKNAKLLHFTLGLPCFIEYADAPMAAQWHREKMLMNHSDQRQHSGISEPKKLPD